MSVLSKAAEKLAASTAVIVPDSREDDEAKLARIEEVRETLTADDYANMRSHYLATYGKETSLDDDDILEVIAASEDDNEPKVWAGMMREVESAQDTQAMIVSPEASRDVLAFAHTLGEKLNKDAAFVATSDKIGEAKGLTVRGPAVIYQFLNANWSDDEWARVPKPGVKKAPGMNEPYDIWVIPNVDDPKKTTKLSFFTEVARTISYYRDVEEQHTIYNEASKPADRRSQEYAAKASAIASSESRSKIKANVASYAQKKNTFMSNLKKACELRVQLVRCNQVPGVICTILTEEQPNGTVEVMRTSAPIELARKSNRSICETMAVQSFLKLRPNVAIANAQGKEDLGLKELIASNPRAPKTTAADGSGAAGKYPPLESADDFDSCLSTIGHFVDVKDNLLKVNKWFKEGTPEEIAEKVQLFGDAFLPLQSLWVKVRPVYEELQTREEDRKTRLEANAGLNTKRSAA